VVATPRRCKYLGHISVTTLGHITNDVLDGDIRTGPATRRDVPAYETILMRLCIAKVIHMILVNIMNVYTVKDMTSPEKCNPNCRALSTRQTKVVHDTGDVYIPNCIVALTHIYSITQPTYQLEPIKSYI
jgi:hypothetical protein